MSKVDTKSAMEYVYLLWHTYEPPGGCEESKLLGVYSTRERAEKRMFAARELPGFRDHADGFLVDQYKIDRDGWREGFERVPIGE